MNIKLFGTKDCHKTQYYKTWLETRNLDYVFLDVKHIKEAAEELRSLYETGKLNFPTILVNEKKLRNPTEEELIKWTEKLK
jgi:arsenate reductase-like glutaredoxin family protein